MDFSKIIDFLSYLPTLEPVPFLIITGLIFLYFWQNRKIDLLKEEIKRNNPMEWIKTLHATEERHNLNLKNNAHKSLSQISELKKHIKDINDQHKISGLSLTILEELIDDYSDGCEYLSELIVENRRHLIRIMGCIRQESSPHDVLQIVKSWADKTELYSNKLSSTISKSDKLLTKHEKLISEIELSHETKRKLV